MAKICYVIFTSYLHGSSDVEIFFTACPGGTYGVNCSQRCPTGLYGERCGYFCKCPPEQCIAATGCITTSPAASSQMTTGVVLMNENK